MAKKLTKAMEDLQIAVFTAGQKLNVLTGYSEIEALKKSIEALGIFPFLPSPSHPRHARKTTPIASKSHQRQFLR
jgi:hypothetical protein